MTMIDVMLTFFACMALYLSTRKNAPKANKIGPIVGLLGEPLWFYESYVAGQVGIFITTIVFSMVYVDAFCEHWDLKKPKAC